MGRIRILSDKVANQIAAGEVVERPASVAKELLENALDAGATDIRLDVESGGRRLLRIVDDGCGMLRDDALLAFERHATSKLNGVDDLLSIATLGFRGEALPSIASVSRLLLETRSADETTGTTVELAGGKLLRCDESALARGTSITVRDLFFNVPARRKFLRTDPTELAHIASLVTHYSLAHPDKSFSLRDGANELLAVTPVRQMRERVFQVFGSKILDDLVEVGEQRKVLLLPAGTPEDGPIESEFRLGGFVSRPQVQKLNRNSIFLFVNGRLIRDRLLLHAISSAYHNLMPPACYPFALLFLTCACEEVDVNVHPSKTEVRFRHSSFVHDFVRDVLREVLMASRPQSSVPMGAISPQRGAELPYSEFSQRMALPVMGEFSELTMAATVAAERQEDLPVFTLNPTQPPAPRFQFGSGSFPMDAPARPRAAGLPVPDTHGALPLDLLEGGSGQFEDLSDLRPLGQIHDSFIIAAGRDGLWIIDQHVAHERILFEQVLKQRASGRVEMQNLLMPVIVELTAAQQVQYARIADELNATGFDTEPFGQRTIAIKAAPAGVGPGDIERLLFEVLEIQVAEFRGTSIDDLRRGIAASIACRAAIKIHTRLDAMKMSWLISALAATEYPMSCPHGRPIALRYATKDILKGFHRI